MRQLRQKLHHCEALVEQARIDLAAYGRSEDDSELASIDAHRQAEQAVARAAGVLRFAPDLDQPLTQELRALYTAVAPVITEVLPVEVKA